MITQSFVEERQVKVENLKKGKTVLKEDFSYKQADMHLNEVQVGPDYSVQWNGNRHRLTEWGFRNLLKLHGIPEDFGLAVPSDLTQYNCEKLKDKEDKKVRAFLRDDGSVVNFVKRPYHTARNSDVLKLAGNLPYLPRRVQIADRGIELSMISEEFEELEPEVGDITKIGYHLHSSETGGDRPQAKLMLYRLSCRNGATLADQWGSARWPYDRRMRYESCLEKFKSNLASLSLDHQLLAERYKNLVNKRINQDQFIKIWRTGQRVLDSREAADRLIGVDKDQRQEIYRQNRKRKEENKKRLRGEPEPPEPTEFTAYQLLNRLTLKAKNYPFAFQQKLERLGGKFLHMMG